MSTEACAPHTCTKIKCDRGGVDLGTTNYWVCDLRQVPTVGSTGHPWEKGLRWE